MKRIAAVIASLAIAAVLAGCSASQGTSPVDLTDSKVVSALCGDNANETLELVTSAADAKANTGKRNALTKWGLSDKQAQDDDFLQSLIAELEGRAATPCEASDDAEGTDQLSDELKVLLDAANAPLDDYSCSVIVERTGGAVIDDTYALFVQTLLRVAEGNPDLRQWSDALSTPLKGANPEEMRTWMYRAICEEPVIGVSLAHLFAHLEVKGVRVLSLQSTDWLEFANVDDSKIAGIVADFTPLTVWKLQNPGKTDVPDAVYTQALSANHDYRDVASRLVYLVSRYQLAQVMSIDSTHHYHLVAGGLTADGIPEVEVSHEVDSRASLVFFLTEKTACVPISVLAFNIGDKRPMLGEIPSSCETLVPPPPSGGCTTDCGGNPPCVTDCPKDWDDSVTKPDGVTPEGAGPLKPRPTTPAEPAPVLPEDETPSSGSQAPGATAPSPRPTPPPATGDDGTSINGSTGTNQGNAGNPFG